MTAAASSISPTEGETYPNLPEFTSSASSAGVGSPLSNGVGQRLHAMSDEEREKHIASCGYLMEDAWRRYCETGCFSHRGEADRWRLLMEEAIRGRSAAQVARLERERGLR